MFTATAPSFRVTATAFAASMLGTALVFAVPQAVHAAPQGDFIRKVENQIAARADFAPVGRGVATLAVKVDAAGNLLDVAIVDSTGDKLLDADAIATTRALDWPAGRARNVAVVLTYGSAHAPAKVESVARVNRYVNAKGEALASQNPATPVG